MSQTFDALIIGGGVHGASLAFHLASRGTGFKIAPAVGLCMSEWILDGSPSSVDISIFSPTRFAEGRHLVGEHPYESIWR